MLDTTGSCFGLGSSIYSMWFYYIHDHTWRLETFNTISVHYTINDIYRGELVK